jgi:hypothetical protein
MTTPTGGTPGRTWRWIGVAVVVALALVLFGATLWVSQGGGAPLAGATGAGTTTPSPGASSVELQRAAETPVPEEPAPAETTPEQPAPPSAEPVPEPDESEVPAADVPVNVAPLPELPPVPLSEDVAPVPGLVVSIDNLEAVTGEAQGPGEVGGPALRFTLTLRNDGTAPVSLESTVVTLYSGPEQTPAVDLRGTGAVPLPAEIAAGATVTGVFVFTVPLENRDQVKIGVDYTVGVPIVVFEGAAPR